jgi:hypothetical protein
LAEGAEGVEGAESTFYTHASGLTGMIARSPGPATVRVCPHCSGIADTVEELAMLSVDCRESVVEPAPPFSVPHTEFGAGNQMLTSEATALMLEGDATVLSDAGGHLEIAAGQSSLMRIFVVQFAILLRVFVEASDGDFAVSLADGTQLKRDKDAGDEQAPFAFAFAFPEPPMTQTVALCISAGGREVVVSRLRILYICTEYPVEAPPVDSHWPEVAARPGPFAGTYTPCDRTDIIMIPHAIVSRFQVQMLVDRTAPVPVSLVVAWYLNKSLTFHLQVVLPELENKTKLWYVLDHAVEADCVKVFYVDRLPTMRPHIVRIAVDEVLEGDEG